MKTDTTEKGLEALIVNSLVADAGYEPGRPEDYDREYAVDVMQLLPTIDVGSLWERTYGGSRRQ